ncbi:MAG: DUF1540 domain-containing protein [Clostridiales bacterium]|nr:DUF1540 domain-containing protein [Clostridiales bacterium]
MHGGPKMEVLCSVQNCKYNKEEYCHASKIEVNAKGYKDEAHSSDDALCTTFKVH